MLKPNKHTNLDMSVLGVSAVILERVKKRRVVKYEDLRTYCLSKRQELDELFIPALNLLYLLDRIEYHQKTDSVEYTEQ